MSPNPLTGMPETRPTMIEVPPEEGQDFGSVTIDGGTVVNATPLQGGPHFEVTTTPGPNEHETTIVVKRAPIGVGAVQLSVTFAEDEDGTTERAGTRSEADEVRVPDADHPDPGQLATGQPGTPGESVPAAATGQPGGP